MGRKIPLEAFKKHLRRLGSPADVMARLGLDEFVGIADEHDDPLHKHSDRVIDHLLNRFGTPERVLAKLGMDEAMLTEPKHMRSDPRDGRGGGGGEILGGVHRSGEDDDPPIERPSPEQEMTAGDDEPGEEFDPLREHLRKAGLGEDEIEQACSLARDHVRRRRANGRDRHADDFLPKNRLKGGRGGRFGGPRHGQHTDDAGEIETAREYMRQIDEGDRRKAADHSEEDPNNEYLIDHGMDRGRRFGRDRHRARDNFAVDEIHRLLRRFEPGEAGAAPERYRGASDAAPSSADRSRFAKRFPEVKRIGDASHDGELPPHSDRIGGF